MLKHVFRGSSAERLQPDPDACFHDSALNHLVSVVTPNYNEAGFLRRVVESVANQTISVLEHIIIDDGSRDESAEILQDLENEFPHLRVVRQEHLGAAAARNEGIRLARGRYIAFLDADDIWFPEKIQNQVSYMERFGYEFTYGDYIEVNIYDNRVLRQYQTPVRVAYRDLLQGCPIGCLTVMYNQEKIGKHYMPVVKSGHDWGLWLQITGSGVTARKYPGLYAAYSNGRSSLSSRKFRKIMYVYRIYRTSRNLSRASSIIFTLQHIITAAAKKIRLVY